MISTLDFSVEKKNVSLHFRKYVWSWLSSFLSSTLHWTALNISFGGQNGVIFHLTVSYFPATLTKRQRKSPAVSRPGPGDGCHVGWMGPLSEEVTGISVKPFQKFEHTAFSFWKRRDKTFGNKYFLNTRLPEWWTGSEDWLSTTGIWFLDLLV